MGDIRETFEIAHKVVVACVEAMEVFGAFHRRIRRPHDYGESVPYECETPAVLRKRMLQLHSLTEQLEICYLYDPASKVDILRGLSSRPRVPVHAMLNVTAETHVEAVYLVGSHIDSCLKWVCESMGSSFEAIDRQPNFASDCERAADKLRDFTHNGPTAATALDYLRRALANEEATCHAFFNPSTVSVDDILPPPADPSSDAKPVTWQQAKQFAEAHLARNPWPGLKAMATLAGCSPSTMSKARDNSEVMRKAEAEFNESRQSPTPRQLADSQSERLTKDGDVSEVVGVDELFKRLIAAENDPVRRATLENMTPQQRRELVSTVESDPDGESWFGQTKTPTVRERSRRSKR